MITFVVFFFAFPFMEAWVTQLGFSYFSCLSFILPIYLSGRDCHCGLVGYQVRKQFRVTTPSKTPFNITVPAGTEHPQMLNQRVPLEHLRMLNERVPFTVKETKGRPEQFTLETPGKSREGLYLVEYLFIITWRLLSLVLKFAVGAGVCMKRKADVLTEDEQVKGLKTNCSPFFVVFISAHGLLLLC